MKVLQHVSIVVNINSEVFCGYWDVMWFIIHAAAEIKSLLRIKSLLIPCYFCIVRDVKMQCSGWNFKFVECVSASSASKRKSAVFMTACWTPGHRQQVMSS